MIERFLNQVEFSSYEDFMQHFKLIVPEHFNFGYDVIAPLEKYTAMCDDVVRLEKNTLSLPEDEGKGTFVLTPPVK